MAPSSQVSDKVRTADEQQDHVDEGDHDRGEEGGPRPGSPRGHQAHRRDRTGEAHRAQGHAGDQPYFMPRGRPVSDWRFPPAMQGSAALYSTAADLLDFAVAHLDAGAGHLNTVLADNLRVRRPQPQDAPGIAWVTDDFDGMMLAQQVTQRAPIHR